MLAQAVALAVFVVAFFLIATEWIHRVVIALVGASLMLALRLTTPDLAFFSKQYGVDWDVIFLLLGMMIIVGVLHQTGVFEFLAVWAAKRVRGSPYRMMVVLVLLTAVASALLDNVTTVLLVAPVTVVIAGRLGVSPVPYLLCEAFASNIGGAATLVGDPPNIIIASRAGLSYFDFLAHMAPVVCLLLGLFVLVVPLLFRGAFVGDPRRITALMSLDERQYLKDRALLIRAIVVLALVTIAFVLHSVLHMEPAVVALLGAGVLLLVAKSDPEPILREVDWSTLLFFVGLFIMVGTLVQVGLISELASYVERVTGDRFLLAILLLVWGSALVSGLVDNIPYVAMMTPVVATLSASLPAEAHGASLWWALALGADLGGNATAIGASANVIVLGVAARSGHPVSFWEFSRAGIPVTAMTLIVATAYLWLRYGVGT